MFPPVLPGSVAGPAAPLPPPPGGAETCPVAIALGAEAAAFDDLVQRALGSAPDSAMGRALRPPPAENARPDGLPLAEHPRADGSVAAAPDATAAGAPTEAAATERTVLPPLLPAAATTANAAHPRPAAIAEPPAGKVPTAPAPTRPWDGKETPATREPPVRTRPSGPSTPAEGPADPPLSAPPPTPPPTLPLGVPVPEVAARPAPPPPRLAHRADAAPGEASAAAGPASAVRLMAPSPGPAPILDPAPVPNPAPVPSAAGQALPVPLPAAHAADAEPAPPDLTAARGPIIAAGGARAPVTAPETAPPPRAPVPAAPPPPSRDAPVAEAALRSSLPRPVPVPDTAPRLVPAEPLAPMRQAEWPATPPEAVKTVVPLPPGAAAIPVRLDVARDAKGEIAPPAPLAAPDVPAPAAEGMPAPAPMAVRDAAPPAHTGAAAAPARAGTQEEDSPAGQVAPALAQLRPGPDGTRGLRLRLYPAHLGEVTVHLRASPDGAPVLEFAATRAETLALLRAEAGRLHQALDQAGIAVEARSLIFSLAPTPGSTSALAADAGSAGGQHPHPGGQGTDARAGAGHAAPGPDGGARADAPPPPGSRPARARAGGIDITA